MRVFRYIGLNGVSAFGIAHGNEAFATIGSPFTDMQCGDSLGQLSTIALLAPVQPGKIICVAMNYIKHVLEREPWREMPKEPSLFLKPPSAVIGPGEFIQIPFIDHPTHHEAELVAVIGRTARSVLPQEALEYVFGYTCGNDVTDEVLHDVYGQGIRAKSYETFCPIGPWIETDLDTSTLNIYSRTNGELRQSGSTSEMLFDLPTIISFISSIMTLNPGDMIMTGTPAGISAMSAGDIVEIGIEGIGVLSNPVRICA